MATFSQWVKLQEPRDDAVGFFARYWDAVTPGKISSVAGVRRYLDKLAAQIADSGGTEESERAGVKHGAALSGLELAVTEYNQAETRDLAIRQGVLPDPAVEAPPASGYTGWPQGTLALLAEQQGSLLSLLAKYAESASAWRSEARSAISVLDRQLAEVQRQLREVRELLGGDGGRAALAAQAAREEWHPVQERQDVPGAYLDFESLFAMADHAAEVTDG